MIKVTIIFGKGAVDQFNDINKNRSIIATTKKE